MMWGLVEFEGRPCDNYDNNVRNERSKILQKEILVDLESGPIRLWRGYTWEKIERLSTRTCSSHQQWKPLALDRPDLASIIVTLTLLTDLKIKMRRMHV
jgi:hypothetical protein